MNKKYQSLTFFKGLLAMFLLFWIVVGGLEIREFWSVELKSKKLYSYVPVPANNLKIHSSEDSEDFSFTYSYEYEGRTYSSDRISPYPTYNARAIRDAYFRKWISRSDKAGLIVFVNPNRPDEVSVVRGLARENRIEKFAYGMVIVTLGLAGLYFIFRPMNRVVDLF